MKNEIENDDPFVILSNIERINKLEPEEAKREFIHLAKQFKVRYKYLVGEWANSRKAKSTITGKFVACEEIKKYLDNIL